MGAALFPSGARRVRASLRGWGGFVEWHSSWACLFSSGWARDVYLLEKGVALVEQRSSWACVFSSGGQGTYTYLTNGARRHSRWLPQAPRTCRTALRRSGSAAQREPHPLENGEPHPVDDATEGPS